MTRWDVEFADLLAVDDALADVLDELRGLGAGPVVEPSPELAARLAAARPLRRRRRPAFGPLAAAAATALIVAGGAAVQHELPEPAQDVVSTVIDRMRPPLPDVVAARPAAPSPRQRPAAASPAPAVRPHPEPTPARTTQPAAAPAAVPQRVVRPDRVRAGPYRWAERHHRRGQDRDHHDRHSWDGHRSDEHRWDGHRWDGHRHARHW
jgi:hypothetical protein